MLWNCGHAGHDNLTVGDVNMKSGTWLHNFKWLEDQDIGALPEEWNWLDGHSPEDLEPKNVHFTTGGPWFDTWIAERFTDLQYSNEWVELRKNLSNKK